MRVEGTAIWEKPVESAATESVGLSFTADAGYLIYARHFNDPARPLQEIKIWNQAGALVFEHSTELPRLVRPCGGPFVLIQEIQSRQGHHFILVDASKGRAVSEFTVSQAVQDVRPRISEDGQTLYLGLHYRDGDGRVRVRLEARNLTGSVVAQRELGSAMASSWMLLSSYGDGAQWLAPAEGTLWLLKPR